MGYGSEEQTERPGPGCTRLSRSDNEPSNSRDVAHFAPPPPRMLRGDLAQPGAEHPLDLDHRGRAAALGAAGLAHYPTRPSLGTPEPFTEHLHGAASTVRAQKFPRFSSLSMSMSKA